MTKTRPASIEFCGYRNPTSGLSCRMASIYLVTAQDVLYVGYSCPIHLGPLLLQQASRDNDQWHIALIADVKR